MANNNFEENQKGENNKKTKSKKKVEPMKVFTTIIAAILCVLMLLSVCGTLLFYLFS